MGKKPTEKDSLKISEAAELNKPKLDEFDEKTLKALLGKKLTLVELANKLDSSPKAAEKAVERLSASGHNVTLEEGAVTVRKEVAQGSQIVVDSKDFFDGEWHKFGVLGDTHLYSKYARLDVLNCLYDIYEKEGIHTVFHTGNIIEGEFRFNKFDLVGSAGMEAQLDYLAEHYPRRDGITTKYITGDCHEGWYINKLGINIGQRIQQTAEAAGRNDLEFIGHIEADLKLKAKKGSAWVRFMHPGGGTAYAISYTAQKIVEAYQGGEKPHILFLGHYHKFDHGYPREVHTIQTGCTQDQTPFMRKLKLQAHVGGTIVRFHQADTGEINRLAVEWIPYYDKGFYEKLDKYRRW